MKAASRLVLPVGLILISIAVVFQEPLKTPLLRSISLASAVLVALGLFTVRDDRARTVLLAAEASILIWFVTRITTEVADLERIDIEALGAVASMCLLGAAIVLVGGRPIGWHRRTELAALVPLALGTALAAGFLGVRLPPGIPAETSPWVAVVGWGAAGLLLAVIIVGVVDGRTHLRSRRLLLIAAGLVLVPALASATPYFRSTTIGWVGAHLAIAAAAFERDLHLSVRSGARGPFRRTRLVAAVAAAIVPVVVLLAAAVIGGRDGREPMALVGALVVAAVIWIAWRQTAHRLSREAGTVLRDWASGGAEAEGEGDIVRWDERFWALLGAEDPEESGSLVDRIEPSERRVIRGALVGAAAGRVSVVRCRTVAGAPIEVVVAPGPHGSIIGVSQAPESQRQREAAHRRETRDQVTDPMTGLMGRDAFVAEVERMASVAGARPALLFVDFDGIDDVARVHGRDAVAGVVGQLTERLAAVTPSSGRLARLRADEFAVVLPSPGRGDVGQVGVGILTALAEPADVNGAPVRVAVHLDVAESNGESAAEIVGGVGARSFEPAEWGASVPLPRRVPQTVGGVSP